MEIKKYRLQTEMENLKEGNEEWFKDYVRGVLESNKPYFEKADYIAYSINQISNKLDYISNEIKELQELKKFLSNSKELAMQITASILTNEYGISKLESGVAISSITITPEKSKTSQVITIKNEQAVLGLGYVSFIPDYSAIEVDLANKSKAELKDLMQFIEVNTITEITPQKIKINNKKAVNPQKSDEIIIEENVA
ncbi:MULTISPECIES: hypothetical protein [Aliarcobacter]|jgi:uncharacterized protein YoxC|uniref:Uncharacterized protein n=4 Tax=Arcobacteraceae TaxID=2808963 RepID=A0AA96IJL4_9BACT|nr:MULTISPECIES: hypothetical protein [Aliarcobacter]WNL34398.1 hypothetical protein RMP68_02025 [Arcobacter sp. AZ-2023]WPD11839.1 hypothetical protein QT384_10610 [Arcobacter sp. DSM 115960]MCT7482412.1 hypothetical protein [Aliarcobacter cryaerophilus]MCT7527444.1 hypothetical protein [Aliarcobacter cryaerophilus]MCT7553017.1 hypothetical protein [Aliarcobacter butzleri]